MIDPGLIQQNITKETVLVSIQHGNPEIGTLQPIDDISRICRERNILLHSDCVQTFGKIDIKQTAVAVDALSVSGHKFYGPKGTGTAFIRPQITWQPFLEKTSHEKGFRPGTVNVPGVLAMTAAAEKAAVSLEQTNARLQLLRSEFIQSLAEVSKEIIVHGSFGT